jgi:hypothetical protein
VRCGSAACQSASLKTDLLSLYSSSSAPFDSFSRVQLHEEDYPQMMPTFTIIRMKNKEMAQHYGTHEKSSLLLGLGVLCRGLRDLSVIETQTERGEERNVPYTAAHTSLDVVKCIVRHHVAVVVRTWTLASLLHHHLMRPLLRSLLTGACLVYWGFTISRQTFFFHFLPRVGLPRFYRLRLTPCVGQGEKEKLENTEGLLTRTLKDRRISTGVKKEKKTKRKS